MSDSKAEHAARIQDQFSRQALPFAALPAHSNAEGFELLARSARLGPDDELLDVACGPGLVACELAPRVKSARGLDVVEPMIEQARARAARLGLDNVAFDAGDCTQLPYADGSFSRVVTRYSFHHLLEPALTLREMTRVCRPGGTITVCDAAPARDKRDAYNRMEKLRDPSHAAALCPEQLEDLFSSQGLQVYDRAQYRLEVALEDSLAASFPAPGAADKLREMFEKDLSVNDLGVGATRRGQAIWFSFPIMILSARV
ncbi:MAG TPA: class I SAM-dependent methyltransferase [Polyangiaceae bacterium]|nr:class I SAM-dependent methyltransferase [Polyangiaceae bacterium]